MPSRGGPEPDVPRRPQWLETTGLDRPITAAGPSRIHTGVPCLPGGSNCLHPATKVAGRVYGSGKDCQCGTSTPLSTAQSPTAAAARGKLCRSHTARRCDPDGGSVRLVAPRTHGTSRRISAPVTRAPTPEKIRGQPQAGSKPGPIAPMSPGASLCPSGNQGAAATCDPSSHGMARQACRKSSWITTSG